MAKRMWRKSRPFVSVEGKRGFFDVPYGTVSEKQKFDLWLPEGEGPFPVILSIHGGGFIACDKRNEEMISPMLAGLARGYAVAGINYRLSDECHFPEQIRDIKMCIRYLRAHSRELQIDSEKMVIWGGSVGGYLSLMGALCDKEPFFDTQNDENICINASVAGCVAWYPLVDVSVADDQLRMNSIINHAVFDDTKDSSEEYEVAYPPLCDWEFPFYDDIENGMKHRLLGPYDVPEQEHISDVKRYLHKEMPPVMIQHGNRDEIVPMQQSIEFAIAAEKLLGKDWGRIEIIPEAIHSSVLFETEENLEKVFSFIDSVWKNDNGVKL